MRQKHNERLALLKQHLAEFQERVLALFETTLEDERRRIFTDLARSAGKDLRRTSSRSGATTSRQFVGKTRAEAAQIVLEERGEPAHIDDLAAEVHARAFPAEDSAIIQGTLLRSLNKLSSQNRIFKAYGRAYFGLIGWD